MTFRNTNILFGIIVLGLLVYDLKNNVPTLGYAGAVLIYSFIVFFGTINISWQYFGPAKCKGDSSSLIALTFDDGPAPLTSEILNILKEGNVKATFFCIGKNVKDN